MQIRVPQYFTEFKCIADKCTDNCCIGWEIDLDSDTLSKYRKCKGYMRERLNRGIKEGNPAHFILTDTDRCPFLNDMGLCDIISELGEDHLTEICREHPRYYNVYKDFAEGGLGLCCVEAAGLILGSDKYDYVSIESDSVSPCDLYSAEDLDNILQTRIYIISCVKESSSYEEIKNGVLDIARKCEKNMVGEASHRALTPREIYGLYASLEHFDSSFGLTMQSICDSTDEDTTEAQINRLLPSFKRLVIYFIQRYFSGAISDFEPYCRAQLAQNSAMMIFRVAIQQYGADFSQEQLTEAAKDFSKSVEYSEDNIEALLSAL